jgi:hypothetical protein
MRHRDMRMTLGLRRPNLKVIWQIVYCQTLNSMGTCLTEQPLLSAASYIARSPVPTRTKAINAMTTVVATSW